ncbi:glycosyltransferase [Maribacter aestuarii]|uniref:glycosyltransferase n=1 Tax=Maribacter aestuarii TaxID=1130723 RepID=UPI00248BF636|nr:glycosyltransferase [Maribacter aestuarii]
MDLKKLLVIGYHWPEPTSTAAGVHMMQLLDIFLEENYHITFASTAAVSEHSANLQELGIETQSIELNSETFDEFITTLNPGMVLFDRFLAEEQFGWRVAEQCPNSLRMLDTEDLHSLRHVREELLKEGKPFTVDAWLQNDKTKREIASIYRCDLSLIISTYEMELLTEMIKMDESLVLHLPFLLDEIQDTKQLPSFEDRRDFIFIGGGKHSPNIDAIKWLKTAIWPRIKSQIPEAKLQVYGAYLPQQVLELHNVKEGFLIRGRAEAVDDVMQSVKVCLAPLRFGAGIKGKLINAMQNGTPSVTTDVGAEGMHGDLPWCGSVAKNAEDFAKASIVLYTNKSDWQIAQEQGFEIINTLYSKPDLKTRFLSKLEVLNNNLKQHRTQNFIGALLQQQEFASTKYMGKWIAEKNKK